MPEPDWHHRYVVAIARYPYNLAETLRSAQVNDMFSLRKLRRLAGVFVGVLVFAQAVYAAEACVVSQISAADAVSMQHADMQDMVDCAGMTSAAGCLAQCSAGDQSATYSVIAIPDAPLAHIRVAAIAAFVQLPRAVLDAPAPGSSPSRPIRFCSFLL